MGRRPAGETGERVSDRRPRDVPNFGSHTVRDALGREITFYLSEPRTSEALPLAVFVQGSGCQSVFTVRRDGQVYGGQQNLLRHVAREKARVLVVEKPGVALFDRSPRPGTACGCTRSFLSEHTLERWAAAIMAAIEAAMRLYKNGHGSGVLVIGSSEGGITAAAVAARLRAVTHVALMASSGPTQLFDLALRARASDPAGAEEIYRTYREIVSDPDSIDRSVWGHPFRRWSSFLRASTLDELLKSNASVYLVHGVKDKVVPVEASEVLHAELIRHGRNVVIDLLSDVGHTLARRRDLKAVATTEIFSRIFEWFLASLGSRLPNGTDTFENNSQRM